MASLGNVIVMGDAAMPIKSKRSIITNRQLNFTLSPVDMHNPAQKQMPHSLPNYAIDGTWNHHQSIVLDIILHTIFKGYYSKYSNIPKSWRSNDAIEVNQRFSGKIFTPIVMAYLSKHPIKAFSIQEGQDVEKIERDAYAKQSDDEYKKPTFEEHFQDFLNRNYKYQQFLENMAQTESAFNIDIRYSFSKLDLFKNYPVLERYKDKFFEHAQRIAETKFKMNYIVKCITKAPQFNKKGIRIDKGEMVDAVYVMDNFEQIFSMDLKDDLLVVNFKSPLGKMIIHNTLVLDTDWPPDEVLDLGKNAYFLYKRFILNKVAGKNASAQINLWFEEIKTFLDLSWSNNSGVYSIIKLAFEEMKKKGLIQDFTSTKYAKQRLYRVILETPQKKRGKSKAPAPEAVETT